MSEQVQIRSLHGDDVFTLAPILADQLQHAQQLSVEGRGESEVGVAVLHRALTQSLPQLRPWIADLAGITPEQLKEKPVDFPIQVLQQLMDSGELSQDFFGQVRRLAESLMTLGSGGTE